MWSRSDANRLPVCRYFSWLNESFPSPFRSRRQRLPRRRASPDDAPSLRQHIPPARAERYAQQPRRSRLSSRSPSRRRRTFRPRSSASYVPELPLPSRKSAPAPRRSDFGIPGIRLGNRAALASVSESSRAKMQIDRHLVQARSRILSPPPKCGPSVMYPCVRQVRDHGGLEVAAAPRAVFRGAKSPDPASSRNPGTMLGVAGGDRPALAMPARIGQDIAGGRSPSADSKSRASPQQGRTPTKKRRSGPLRVSPGGGRGSCIRPRGCACPSACRNRGGRGIRPPPRRPAPGRRA